MIRIGPDSCYLNRQDLSVLGGRPDTTPYLASTRFARRQPCDVSRAVTFKCHEHDLFPNRTGAAVFSRSTDVEIHDQSQPRHIRARARPGDRCRTVSVWSKRWRGQRLSSARPTPTACAGPASSSSRSVSDACDAGSLAGDAVAPPGVSPGAGDLYSGSATGRAARPTLAPPTWLALLSAMSALYLRPSYGGTAGGVACGGSVPVPPSFGCQKPARVQGVVARPPIWIDIR